jgi:phosphoglycolate phosphatase
MAQNIERIALFDGIGPALQQLSDAGVVLAVVSSNSVDNVHTVLGPYASLITHFECGVDLFGKRHKLRRLRALTGVQRHEMLCIGDELRDIDAARAEKIPVGVVAWGYSHFAALLAQSPEEAFSQVDELVPCLLQSMPKA